MKSGKFYNWLKANSLIIFITILVVGGQIYMGYADRKELELKKESNSENIEPKPENATG